MITNVHRNENLTSTAFGKGSRRLALALGLTLALAGCGAPAEYAATAAASSVDADAELDTVVHHIAPVEAPRGLVEDFARSRAALEPRGDFGVREGEVDWERFLGAMAEIEYQGYYTIDRETSDDRIADVKQAIEFFQRY